jgi:hypothetical protein
VVADGDSSINCELFMSHSNTVQSHHAILTRL